jgi:UDP-N-acetylglucosamine 1-carboxyvinyltransferase
VAYIEVTGGKKLYGDIHIQGSKNAVLPILAASVLHKGTSTIHHCPEIADVQCMLRILESIGCDIKKSGSTVIIDTNQLNCSSIPEEYVSKMRSSIILLGSLLGRNHFVTISYPGGCTIGARPIDLHLKGLKRLNVDIIEANDLLTCMSTNLKGSKIKLDFPSVGATENIILAAVLAEGITEITGAAMEPEISCLCRFLSSMGAEIHGTGTSKLTIVGVKELHDCEFTMPADRIVAGTYMIAVAGTGGDITLHGLECDQLKAAIQVISSIGGNVTCAGDTIRVIHSGKPGALDIIRTSPYPGFPTDLQSQIMTVLSVASGNSILVENIFEDRYRNVTELQKMGANIETEGKIAIIRGVDALHGATVKAFDLRGGAALVMAGMIAEGVTKIESIQYIMRGYVDICKDLSALGASIRLISD